MRDFVVAALVIRLASSEDADAVRRLSDAAVVKLRAVYVHDPQSPMPAVRGAFERIVAEIGGVVVGTVRVQREENRLHLIGLFVHPDYQRRGVARGMIEECTIRARAAGLGRVSLYTIRQTGNVGVFERLGFGVVSEEAARGVVSVTGVELTDVYMELQLR